MNNDGVDINGNHADAGGGASATIPSPSMKFRDYSSAPRPNKIINDFITTPQHHHHHKPAHADGPKPPDNSLQHQPDVSANHHHPQHSKTLMRWSVRKPDLDSPHKPAGTIMAPSAPLPPKPVPTVDDGNRPNFSHQRLEHAKAVARSPIVSRFRNSDISTDNTQPQTLSPAGISPTDALAQPAPLVSDVGGAAAGAERVSPHDVVNEGFLNAKSHEQALPKAKSHKKSRRGVVRLARVLVTIIIIVGLLSTAAWVAYEKVPGVGVRIASIRSGINVTSAGYVPAGFVYRAPVKYYKNLATISYVDGSANQTFYLAEQTTNWNSQAVLNNVVLINNYAYQTVKQGGLVIYVYGPSNASWVRSGLLYTVYGNAKLSPGQLAHIATSIT